MGISDRCNGIHLLNHFRQTNVPLDINYIQLREYSEIDEAVVINQEDFQRFSRDKNSWACTLQIKDSPTYVCFNFNKRAALLVLLENIDARRYL